MASSSSSSSPDISVHHNSSDHFSFKYASQDEVLEDLSSRFILNLPDEELASVERICFQVEQAHWFYEDFIREENPRYPSLPLKKFSAMLFNACPLLRQWSADHEQAFNTFMQYKTRVPVCGAIMLNDTWEKCVLVKGWKPSSGWGFPKGKINQDEEPHHCAIREVLEETGYDLSDQIRPDDRIELSIREQKITLYIVGGIPEDYSFQTKTRKEISKIEWFTLSDLPTWKRNKAVPGKFYLISPFVPRLKEYINERRSNQRSNPRKSAKTKHTPPINTGSIHEIGEERSASVVQDHIANGRDPDMPSSSSQSSADNGDPYTPSPQYLQAQPITTDKVVEEVAPIDPHFARLLSGLSLSASKPVGHCDPENAAVVPIAAPTSSIERETKKERLSGLSEKVQELEQPPRSELVPTPVSDPQDSASLRFTAPHSLPLQPSTFHGKAAVTRNPRRRSSTADILPYLSKVPEASGSDRRLKQLALLESVASESSRMGTPALGHRDTAAIPLMQPLRYLPPPSVPLLPIGAAAMPPTYVPYNMPGTGYGPPHQSFGRPFPHPLDDHFQVRPRTSNAAFPPSMSMPSHTSHSMSMHQAQLLTLMGSSNMGPQPLTGPSFNAGIPFDPSAPPPQSQGPLIPQGMPAAVARFDTGSQPTPHPGFPATPIVPRAANKGQLLSILNSNSTLTADAPHRSYASGSPASNMITPGVLNGITHR